jgi:hypothetical protein
VGVNRQLTPTEGMSGDAVRWYTWMAAIAARAVH